MMDRRFAAVLTVSALFAAFVAAIFYRLAAAGVRPAPPVVTRPVVVAAANLPLGTMVRRSDLKLVSMPENLAPRTSFTRIEDVQNRPVIGTIFLDEPVLPDRLAASGSGAGLAPMIPAGQRAVSIRVNDVIGVSGFVQPGMRVDVLVTGRPPGSEDSVTRTVLQNIVVLSAGQVLQPEPKGQAINATVVTLQVLPAEAEILTMASGEGHVQLVLRNSNDIANSSTPGSFLSSLYNIHGKTEPARRNGKETSASRPLSKPIPATQSTSVPPVESAPTLTTIEVVRGSRVSLEPVLTRDAPKQPERRAYATNQH